MSWGTINHPAPSSSAPSWLRSLPQTPCSAQNKICPVVPAARAWLFLVLQGTEAPEDRFLWVWRWSRGRCVGGERRRGESHASRILWEPWESPRCCVGCHPGFRSWEGRSWGWGTAGGRETAEPHRQPQFPPAPGARGLWKFLVPKRNTTFRVPWVIYFRGTAPLPAAGICRRLPVPNALLEPSGAHALA